MMKNFCRQVGAKDAVVFSVFGQNFLFSASSLTYFPITDCAAELILNDFTDEKFLKSLESKFSQKEIFLTVNKIREFYDKKIICERKNYSKGEIFYNDYHLKLVQSTRCNLNCSYCFSKKDSSFDMSVETAKKAILFFVEKFVPDKNRRIIVDLTGSGEPLVRFDFVIEVNKFVLELKKKLNLNIFCQLATNGMLLSKEKSDLMKKSGILFGVSLDGNKEKTEKNRCGLNYDLVSKNIFDIENKDFFGLASTYSGNNYDFVEIFKSLAVFKPEVIGMKPVRLLESDLNSVNMNNIEEIKKSYEKFLKWIYKQLVGGRKDYFEMFIKSEDFLVRFLKITLRPFRVFYRCSSAVNSFAVDSKGNILICPAFVGKKEGVIGNLENGIEPGMKKKFEALYADKISWCKNCWARYTCAGECFAVGFSNFGIFERPSKAMCELKKFLIQLSVYFWTCLRFEHEDLYQQLLQRF